MKVPFLDLNVSDKIIFKEIKNTILDVVRRKDFILGKEVKEFEKKFAEFVGCRYSLGVSSGTSALFLSLKALGIENSYIITTPFTFTATAEVIVHAGARIVFADIDENTYNISVDEIEKCIDKFKNKIRVIIPVHLYGQPCDMQKITQLCKKYNIKIVEDAAQAHGAQIKFIVHSSQFVVKKVGSIGDTGCFSFYPTKNLGCYGDGGAITTNDKRLYESLLRLRNHGRIEHYLYKHLGYNARLDNIQAAILLVKLKYLDKWNKERQKIAEIYNSELKNVGDIITPYVANNVTHVYHLYVIRTKYRDKLMKYLQSKNIGCAVQYAIPLHLQPAYKGLFEIVSRLQNAEKVSKEVLSLPIYSGLKESQIAYIIDTIKKFFKSF